MKDKISIILPVYNVEKYLNKCIDSILNQTYKNFELIIIDDGSTDNSSNICDSYKTDSRVIVIHQENKGLSVARNVGIDLSKGKYITFIDSDDYIDNKYIETLYNIISKNKADIVICDKIEFKENNSISKELITNYTSEVITKEETYKRLSLTKGVTYTAWAKLYRRDIFNSNKYLENKLYEDIFIINNIIEACNKIVVTNYNGYYYLLRNNSLSNTNMSKKQLDLIEAATNYKNFMFNNYPALNKYTIKRYIYWNQKIYTKAVNNKSYRNEYSSIRKEILKYKKDVFSNDIYSKKEKLQTLLLLFGNTPYKLFYKIYKKGC